LVASLNRPGGNATGVTIFGPAAAAKRLQLLHELVPKVAIIGFLRNPNNPNAAFELSAAQEAARSLGKEIVILNASSKSELDAAFAVMAQRQVGALLGASKGEKPGDLPVVQSTKFEFVINLQAARALGIEVQLHAVARR
jgi:putative ABC transport system substrate-binding protein